MSTPTAFIIGFGQRIGTAVAAKFKSEGFNVAVASRSLSPENVQKEFGYFGIKLDVANPPEIAPAFAQVEKKFGSSPNVVVYNAAGFVPSPGGDQDPLSLSFEDFVRSTYIGGLSGFEAARLANEGFDKLGNGIPRAFIATGNSLPWLPPSPRALSLSTGKKILANVVEVAATAYGPAGKRFYFASEVTENGGLAIPPDAASHGTVFWRLYEEKEQGPWNVRFLKGGGIWKA